MDSVRARALATASLVAMTAAAFGVFGTAAIAQDEAATQERIVVTGSRISQRSGFTTPTPVTVVGSAELSSINPGQVVESLSALPQFLGNQTPQTTGFPSSAGSNLNLRGAGINRTLTLLDGRRLVSSNRFNTTDVGVIPETLIRSVETVTGGASASYGSDAVAGVVNFILNTEFEGLEGHAQAGITSRGDGENYEAGFAFGTDLGEKAHFLFSLDVFKQESISDFESLKDRSFYRQVARVTNPDPNGPNWIVRPYASPTDFSNTGIITRAGSPIHRLQFNSDGTTTPLFFNGVGSMTGGCNCQAEADQSYGVDADDEILPLAESGSAFAYFDYDVTPNLNVYLQGMHANSRVDQRREGITLLSIWAPQIFSGNPYLPANVQSLMTANNIPSFTLGFLGLEDPNSPVGDNRTDQENTLYSITGGFNAEFEGGFFDGWHLGGYAQYGTNDQDQQFTNGIRVDRVPVALDAVRDSNGNIVCRAALVNPAAFGNCVPLNVFGGVQNISEEAADYIIDDVKHNLSTVEQTFAEIVFDGELFDGFGAGPVSMAVGASYRKDEFEQGVLDPTDEFVFLAGQNTGSRGLIPELAGTPSPSCVTYNPLQGMCGIRPGSVPGGYLGENNSSTVQFTSGRTFSGGFDVQEGFVEFDVPLLADLPLVQLLSTNWAARYANYSGSGGVWAYKAGVDWQVIDPIRLRGTFSRDTRAAALYERFDQTRGGANINDSQTGLGSYSIASFTLGNPEVDPELADTFTFGAIYQPSGFLEGFQASIDYYSIEVQDAIATLTAQQIYDRCYGINGSLLEPDLCQYIVRNPSTNRVERVESTFLNLQTLAISGVDLEARYSRDMNLFRTGDERMNLRFFASWLEENSVQTSGGTVDDRAGQVGNGQSLPEYKLTANLTYDAGPLSIFLQERYISDGITDRTLIESTGRITGRQTVDDNDVDSVLYTDLGVTYELPTNDGPTVSVFTNVTNLLDQEPPYAPGVVGRTGTTEFNDGLHDTVGRRFVAGVRVRY
jgi:outer membrane receptor protein involved in Fe transport